MSVNSKSSLVPDGFIMGVHLAGVLGLKSDYFTNASRKNIELYNTEVRVINEKYTYVKLDDEVMNRLALGYVCIKISKDEVDDYEFVFKLSRTCIIGMWK